VAVWVYLRETEGRLHVVESPVPCDAKKARAGNCWLAKHPWWAGRVLTPTPDDRELNKKRIRDDVSSVDEYIISGCHSAKSRAGLETSKIARDNRVQQTFAVRVRC
jgi:hypothetical protein